MRSNVGVLDLGGGNPLFAYQGKNRIFNVAVYMSAVDWLEETEDGIQAISEQSKKCREYLREHKDLKKIVTYSDRNSSRDANKEWKKPLDDAEARRIDAVLVSSLSKVGTSFAQADYHVGKFFYPGGIRFVAIDDGFDSLYGDVDAYIKEFATQSYRKTSNDYHEKRFETGGISPMAVPYGYRYEEGHNPEMIVDEPAADVVKMIFADVLSGMSIAAEVRKLNEKKLPTPQMRKHELYGYKVKNSATWKTSVVRNILQNVMYVGDYAIFKTTERRHGEVRVQRICSPEEWMVIKNHHEAIISREQYEKYQSNYTRRNPNYERDQKYKGKAFRNLFVCGHCGSVMQTRGAGVQNGREYESVWCTHELYAPNDGCKEYVLPVEPIGEEMKRQLRDEIRRAKIFGQAYSTIPASEWYSAELLKREQFYTDLCVELEKRQIEHGDTDEVYKQIVVQRKVIQKWKELFTEKNGWYRLFSALDEDGEITLDKATVRKYLKKAILRRDGSVQVLFQKEEDRQQVEAHINTERENGRIVLWAEEDL